MGLALGVLGAGFVVDFVVDGVLGVFLAEVLPDCSGVFFAAVLLFVFLPFF